MGQQQYQPIFVLPEGYMRTQGRDAQRSNIMAAKTIAETVRTTLGPKGMDKMLVDGLGDITITNDGVTILEEMEVSHPAAKMMVEVAKTQEDEVGDGTTTAVVIAGELLKKAEELLEENIHPTVITKGYSLASNKAMELLQELGFEVKPNDKESLIKVAKTAMTGKSAENAREILAKIIVDAVGHVAQQTKKGWYVDLENIKVEKRTGGSVDDSELIEGIAIDKEKVHSSMPSHVQDAKILLLDSAIEIKETETDAKIQITSPDQLESFIDQEQKMIKKIVEQVKQSNCNVVFSQKGIDDIAQYYLAKHNILAFRRIKKSDMEKLSKATGAKIISNISDAKESDLGYAGAVDCEKIGNEDMVYVRNCKNPKSVTILIRGGTEHVIDEIERAVKDSLGDLASVMKTKKVVPGGGSPEIELSLKLLKFSQTLSGKEQLAVKAFAHALEVIPKTLAENAGLDPIEVLTELRSQHEKNKKDAGINVFSGKIVDMQTLGVLEPLKVKSQAVASAAETAIMILRIDDVISAGKSSGGQAPQGPQPGMMPPGQMM